MTNSESGKERMGYVGTCPHGIVMFLAIDEPEVMKESAEEIAEMLCAGYHIDRMPAAEVRKAALNFDTCEICKKTE